MIDTPNVDVVIPCHNFGHLLRWAVDSALRQTSVNVHVTVVDDGSSVPVTELGFEWPADRVRVIRHEERRGIPSAINHGVAYATAPYVSILDADDLWPLNRCRTLIDALAAAEGDLAYGAQVIFNDGDEPLLDVDESLSGLTPALLSGNVLMTSAVLRRVGSFDESVEIGAFIQWVVRGRHLDPPIVEVPIERVTLLRRSHAGNTTRTRTHDFSDYLKAVRLHRRGGSPLPTDTPS